MEVSIDIDRSLGSPSLSVRASCTLCFSGSARAVRSVMSSSGSYEISFGTYTFLAFPAVAAAFSAADMLRSTDNVGGLTQVQKGRARLPAGSREDDSGISTPLALALIEGPAAAEQRESNRGVDC